MSVLQSSAKRLFQGSPEFFNSEKETWMVFGWMLTILALVILIPLIKDVMLFILMKLYEWFIQKNNQL